MFNSPSLLDILRAQASALRPSTQSDMPPDWGPIYLDAPEFEECERQVRTPQRPSPAILEGAALLRRLRIKETG